MRLTSKIIPSLLALAVIFAAGDAADARRRTAKKKKVAKTTRTSTSKTAETPKSLDIFKLDTAGVQPLRPFTLDALGDTILGELQPEQRSGRLTEEDFREVAEELGVEVAAIKAVVEIEAGRTHQGFWTEGKPVINFDLSVFRRNARKKGINLSKYTRSHSVVFSRPNTGRYGSYGAAQQARLDAARQIDDRTAIQSTFWGMFQIGGFNWNKCGASSPDEFVRLMSRSERDQLELFANFVRTTGLLPSLRAKNWRAFARTYNGPSYAARGYHTRLAAAYKRHKGK